VTRADLHKMLDEPPDNAVDGEGVLLRGIIEGAARSCPDLVLDAGVNHAAFLLSVGYVLALYRRSDWPEASRLAAGRVSVNGGFEPLSPFGGFKQSGLGREYGPYGLEGFLEPRSIMAP